MLKRLSLIFAVALLPMLAVGLNAGAKPEVGDAVVLAATSDQAGAARLVHGLLSDSRYHLAPKRLDDALSSQIFDRYIEALDPQRMFFLASDIERFEAAYRTRLDDAIRGGRVDPAFAIYNVYADRVAERVAHARGLLEREFDFDTQDSWTFDREDADFFPDREALDDAWRRSVKNDALRLHLAGREHADIVRTLDRRYQSLGNRVAQTKGEDVFQTFMNAYATAIEPHTGYMTPRTSENFNISMRLSLEGIGAVLQNQQDFVVIRSMVPGGPAALSNRIRVGDRVVAVGQGDDGEMVDVVGWRLDDVVDMIRGPADSQVRLDILPASASVDGEPERVELIRQRVRLEEQAAQRQIIQAEGPEGSRRIGVIKLPTFYQDFEARRRNDPDYSSATRDVERLLGELREEGVDGVVVDLRNNGGGSLNEAIELTGLFIESGPVVQVRDASGRVDVHEDRSRRVAWEGPLAVLINRGSASASEIFAAAVQDYGRGIIIGEQSFGKGTVQNLIDLDRWPQNETPRFGQVKLTVAQFYRPAGGSTQHKGVVPDIGFPVTLDASEFGESSYDNALPWTQVDAAGFGRIGDFGPLLAQLRTMHEQRAAEDPEFQWLLEDIQEYRRQRERTEISLNAEVRRAERDRNEARRQARDEARRELGLAVNDRARADDGLQADERAITEDDDEDERPDPLLRESVNILADAIELLGRDPQLAARVHPRLDEGRWVQ
ncbi:MAG: carboxy terminal-processing peptidase [Lysobacteraceae bacterium]